MTINMRASGGGVGALLTAFILTVLCTDLAQTYEENPKFCIKTEPILLTDMKDHLIPVESDPNCEITATTMTDKEKESFLNTLCKDYGSSHKDDYHFLKLSNGEFAGDTSYLDVCSVKVNPFFAWIPYGAVQQNYAQELNPKERKNYIAKATDVQREKTELCHFRQSDLVTNISTDLFTCIVMIFEDNFYGLDANINVLVDIQPLMYEIYNISYLPWTNVTTSYKTMLGKTILKNTSRSKKLLYNSINYAYVEKVKLNVSSVYDNNLDKLPLLFEHKDVLLELGQDGIGGVNVNEKAYFGRYMDPETTVHVDVIGQWAEHRKQFIADIYDYYGYGIKRFRQQMRNGDVTFVRIESTEPVYEMPDSSHLASITLHNTGKEKTQSARLTNTENESSTVQNANIEEFEEVYPNGKTPYPGFYPWAMVGAFIVGFILLAAIIGMVRSYHKENNKHTYQITKH